MELNVLGFPVLIDRAMWNVSWTAVAWVGVDGAMLALAAVALTWTLLPFLPSRLWWIRAGDFPRLQLMSFALAAATYWVAAHGLDSVFGRALLTTMALCAAYQAKKVLPYTPLWPKQVPWARHWTPERSLKMVMTNVEMVNDSYLPLLESIEKEDPDVVVALEVNETWQRRLEVLRLKYPHVIAQPQENYYGMMLFSRLPLSDSIVEFLIDKTVPSIHTIVTLPGGDRVRLHCLHPKPPTPDPDASEYSTKRDLELLVMGKLVRDAQEDADTEDLPVVVCGDLNDVAWSRSTEAFMQVSKLLDPRIGRGFYNSFHANYPLIMRWSLDHVFHSRHFHLAELKLLPRFGSDHFPVCVRLALPQANAASAERSTADVHQRSVHAPVSSQS